MMIDVQPPDIPTTDDTAMMYPAETTIAAVSAATGPKALPMNVMNDPVDGMDRENSASVFPSRMIAMTAATIVSGDATPAVAASSAKPKKKLIAGPMFAIVDAVMSARPRIPRLRRSCPATLGRSALGSDLIGGASLRSAQGAPPTTPRSAASVARD